MTYSQIEEEFKGIEGVNELKRVYKKLCKKLHPDVGGTDELFKMLNEIYNNFLEHKIYFSNESKFDLELEKIISKILHFSYLNTGYFILKAGSYYGTKGTFTN